VSPTQTFGRATLAAIFSGVLALVPAAGLPAVAAQPADPEACSAAIGLAYLKSDGVDKDAPPSQAFIDAAMQQPLIRIFCASAGETLTLESSPGDTPSDAPNPARSDPPSAVAPTGGAAAGAPPAADDGPDNRVDTDRSACVLVTVTEVGAAMQQSVTATPADPFGVAGAQGCEFQGQGDAFTNVIYFQANGAFYFDSFQSTAEANGVQAVPGLGDRAFSYVGGNGPGVVVAKGDKLFGLEFGGLGNGPSEQRSLLVLAREAVARVR
jgi:hypothetical protein